MPEDPKKGELDSYFEVYDKEKVLNYEALKWWNEHLQKANYNIGAKDTTGCVLSSVTTLSNEMLSNVITELFIHPIRKTGRKRKDLRL